MFTILRRLLLIGFVLLVSACGTTDGAMHDQGHNEAYVQGFHDGRHSGMKEAGNNWEHFIRDNQRFDTDSDYRSGWIAGEVEGKELQAQAQSLGEAAGGVYTGYKVGEEVDKAEPHPKKIASEVMKGVDTSDMKNLEN